jgi:hypothetical protein
MIQSSRKTKKASSRQKWPAVRKSGSGRARALLPLIIFLALVTTLALAGLLQAGRMLASGVKAQPETDSSAFSIGQSIPTSFGIVVVDDVENLAGLTSQDLGGMTHGIQNLVLADQAQIQVSILLSNQTDSAIYYSPTQFRLLEQQGLDLILPFGATVKPGMLGPKASIEATLSFIAPRNGGRLWIRFDDPGGGGPILVDAGRTDQAPADVLEDIHR